MLKWISDVAGNINCLNFSVEHFARIIVFELVQRFFIRICKLYGNSIARQIHL